MAETRGNSAGIEKNVEVEKKRVKRKVYYALMLLACVYIIAIFVFHFVEGWAWEDSVYFTTSTITTVGYGDLVPRTYFGRLFTIPLMFIGIAVGLYVIYSIQDYGRSKFDAVAQKMEEIRRNGKKRG